MICLDSHQRLIQCSGDILQYNKLTNMPDCMPNAYVFTYHCGCVEPLPFSRGEWRKKKFFLNYLFIFLVGSTVGFHYLFTCETVILPALTITLAMFRIIDD